MKSKETNLVETLAKAANLITPDKDGYVPLDAASNSTGVYVELGYRIGRALSLARQIAAKVNAN